jgi:NADH-quinone oxidoreductase subunit L
MLFLIPALPFAGFVINVFLGRRLPKAVSGGVACAAMGGAFLVSATSFWRLRPLHGESHAIEQTLFTWIASGNFSAPFTFRLDPLAGIMVLVVTGIGFLIHVYSTGYMHEESDREYARYFSYLNLFAAFMLVLVLGASFLVMFVGWEGVGLCSYLLIGFWFRKKSATDAGNKAFIVNRIGDAGFILGMLLIFREFGTLDFQQVARAIAPMAPEATFGVVSAITLLLFVGATGKSAQIPLYVWLPDAMEGPTPVSALIHAATMVTAGVYMIGRNAVLFSHAPETLAIVAGIGVATALMAGTIGLVQTDIKRVLAYSTVSQLGLMFLAMGVGAFAAGIFHLYTHAFFKALLFLGSGAVIHALAGEQDLRRMGGLKPYLPITYWTFLIGALAIAGVPLLSGFFSKDEILYRTFAGGHTVLWIIGAITSLLTAIYMFRLVFLAFHGQRAAISEHDAHDAHHVPARERSGAHGAPRATEPGSGAEPRLIHDAPPSMAIPLIVLAVGSVLAGYVGVPHALGGANRIETFLEPSFEAAGMAPASPEADAATADAHGASAELTLMAVSSGLAVAGIGIAAFFFLRRRDAGDALASRFAGVHRLLSNKYYVDEVYDATIVQPIKLLSTEALWKGIDAGLIDGSVNGTGRIVSGGGSILRKLQTGSVRVYAVSLFLGVVLILGYYLAR